MNKVAPATIGAKNAGDLSLRSVRMSHARELECIEKRNRDRKLLAMNETPQSLTQEQLDAEKAMRLKKYMVYLIGVPDEGIKKICICFMCIA